MAMKRAVVAGVAAAALLAQAVPARAEKAVIPETVRMMEPHLLRIGDYVRAWPSSPGGTPLQGEIVGESPTTLTITGRERAELLNLSSLGRLEIRRRYGHARRGALIGAGVGLGTAFFATQFLAAGPPGTLGPAVPYFFVFPWDAVLLVTLGPAAILLAALVVSARTAHLNVAKVLKLRSG